MQPDKPTNTTEYPIKSPEGSYVGIVRSIINPDMQSEIWQVQCGNQTETLYGGHNFMQCVNLLERMYYGKKVTQKVAYN